MKLIKPSTRLERDLNYVLFTQPFKRKYNFRPFKVEYTNETYTLIETMGTIQIRVAFYDLPSEVITIPKGFIFDGASIPKLLRPFFGSGKECHYLLAAAAHDYLYSYGSQLRVPILTSREVADEIFYRLIQEFAENNLGKIRSALLYMGVRLFGFPSYKGKKNATINSLRLQRTKCNTHIL